MRGNPSEIHVGMGMNVAQRFLEHPQIDFWATFWFAIRKIDRNVNEENNRERMKFQWFVHARSQTWEHCGKNWVSQRNGANGCPKIFIALSFVFLDVFLEFHPPQRRSKFEKFMQSDPKHFELYKLRELWIGCVSSTAIPGILEVNSLCYRRLLPKAFQFCIRKNRPQIST